MEPQHFIVCGSCGIADMQSANGRSNKAPATITKNILLPIILFEL